MAPEFKVARVNCFAQFSDLQRIKESGLNGTYLRDFLVEIMALEPGFPEQRRMPYSMEVPLCQRNRYAAQIESKVAAKHPIIFLKEIFLQ